MSSPELDRWIEARDTLTDLLEWLEDARHWAEAAGSAQAAPDEEATQAARAFAASEPVETPAAQRSPMDLYSVVAEVTALRQEVKLQTRAARQDRELAAKTVDELSGALEQLERWRSEESTRRDAAVAAAQHGAAELLVDLHDALSRSFAEANRIVRASIDSLHASRPFHPTRSRSLISSGAQAIALHARSLLDRLRQRRRGQVEEPDEPVQAAAPYTTSQTAVSNAQVDSETSPHPPADVARQLEGVTDGYTLALRRIERALAEFDIEPIKAIGRTVDPELMEVVQSVGDAAQPPGTVVAEVRRGYRRQGRVMRFAQVVVSGRHAERDVPGHEENGG